MYFGFAGKILTEIQSVIREVRAMAMELRPPSLDDMGLLTTINWLCREFESIYPEIHVDEVFAVDEQQIPKPLKVIIFRVLQEIMGGISKQGLPADISIKLKKADSSLELEVEDNSLDYHALTQIDANGQYWDASLASIMHRVVLSGGLFNMGSNKQGGTVYRMAWDT